MSGRLSPALALKAAAIAAGLALLLAGCSYDYLQHTDRVGYSAGDAVKANLAMETTNPSKRSMYATGGLGGNGDVSSIPPASSAAAAN
ncbi:MAG TPA: hypothetical protein VHZ56_01900 [Devosia sp.]|jgi:hypothetical protein|nr:hypothetical protein [Devosia sp.]